MCWWSVWTRPLLLSSTGIRGNVQTDSGGSSDLRDSADASHSFSTFVLLHSRRRRCLCRPQHFATLTMVTMSKWRQFRDRHTDTAKGLVSCAVKVCSVLRDDTLSVDARGSGWHAFGIILPKQTSKMLIKDTLTARARRASFCWRRWGTC